MRQLGIFLALALALGWGVNYFVPQLRQSAALSVVRAERAPQVLRGGDAYAQYCQHCHGISKIADVPEMTSLAIHTLDIVEFASVLATGQGGMPAFDGMFEPREIDDLFAYLKEPAD